MPLLPPVMRAILLFRLELMVLPSAGRGAAPPSIQKFKNGLSKLAGALEQEGVAGVAIE